MLPCPVVLQFDGVHPEALAVTIDTWGLDKMKGKREFLPWSQYRLQECSHGHAFMCLSRVSGRTT